jgi:hypothetical protein
MSRRLALLLAACLLGPLAAAGEEPPQVDLVPAPKEIHFERGDFELDADCVVLISEQAQEPTRRAAVALQRGIRERFGLDLPVVRIVDQRGRKALWVIEPRILRPPAKTIGVQGLDVTEEMFRDSYFIRVDAPEVVVHGTNDAGSFYGVHTLLQLFRPPRRGTLFRKRRGPTLPCLWIRDFPKPLVRPAPPGLALPAEARAAERVLATLAHYKLNAVAKAAVPAEAADLVRQLGERYHVRIVDEEPSLLPATPLGAIVRRWVGRGEAARYALAAHAEALWATPEPPGPEAFRLRCARETFGDERAAEAIALTEACLDAPPATARERHRALRRIRSAWRRVEREPALRDAFLAVAEGLLAPEAGR